MQSGTSYEGGPSSVQFASNVGRDMGAPVSSLFGSDVDGGTEEGEDTRVAPDDDMD